LTKCFTYTLRVCDQRTTDCGVFSCQRALGVQLSAVGRQTLVSVGVSGSPYAVCEGWLAVRSSRIVLYGPPSLAPRAMVGILRLHS
jgi:hypothetical protein